MKRLPYTSHQHFNYQFVSNSWCDDILQIKRHSSPLNQHRSAMTAVNAYVQTSIEKLNIPTIYPLHHNTLKIIPSLIITPKETFAYKISFRLLICHTQSKCKHFTRLVVLILSLAHRIPQKLRHQFCHNSSYSFGNVNIYKGKVLLDSAKSILRLGNA